MSEPSQQWLYDTHAHLFSSDTARYPIDTSGAREGEHAVRERLAANPIPPERLLQWWDETGVAAGAGVQYNTIYKTDNSYVLDCADQYPERISAVVMAPAAHADTSQKLLAMIEQGRRLAGLRLSGSPDGDGAYPWLDSKPALQTWETVNAIKLVVVIMALPASAAVAALLRIRALAERFCDTQIVLDHCGWPAAGPIAHAPIAQFRDIANVHFKLTTINFRQFDEAGMDAARWVREAADMFGSGRLMWGSDVGNTPETFQQMTMRARKAAALLDEGEARAFLHDNGQALFAQRAS